MWGYMRNATSRLYREIVKGRTQVRVFEASPTTATVEKPIFVIGLYRSGTTLLRYVLDSHTRIAVPPESVFLTGLHEMLRAPRTEAGFHSLGFDRAHVISRMRQFAEYFFANYAASRGKPRWADKTPEYVEHLDFIEELFPRSQFVFVTRNPLDQIHSFVEAAKEFRAVLDAKYGDSFSDPRIAASHYWTDNMAYILRFVESRPNKCFTIKYEDLATRPEQVLPELFAFLGEEWEESVLRFDEFQHDFGLEDNKARLSKGFNFSTGGYRDWPGEIVEACFQITEPVRKPTGYWDDPPPGASSRR